MSCKNVRVNGLLGRAVHYPTPSASSYESNQGGAAGRTGQVRHSLQSMAKNGLWPTPDKWCGDRRGTTNVLGLRPSGAKKQITINDAVKLWPTPTAQDSSSRNATAVRYNPDSKHHSKHHGGTTLTDAAVPQGGSLNPTWVEWLMGFPLGWTALDPSEMPSSRRSRKSSAKRSSKASNE